jgi:hypothetical protein
MQRVGGGIRRPSRLIHNHSALQHRTRVGAMSSEIFRPTVRRDTCALTDDETAAVAAGTNWTGYNTHDPGVAALGLFAFMQFDLVYRSDGRANRTALIGRS